VAARQLVVAVALEAVAAAAPQSAVVVALEAVAAVAAVPQSAVAVALEAAAVPLRRAAAVFEAPPWA
jgi:hypothetical protein